MIRVDCCAEYSVDEGPATFSLMDQPYKVEEIIDRWYGKGAVYFKVRANDQNIYLLKHDEHQDRWDLVFYQNPEKLKILPSPPPVANPIFHSSYQGIDSKMPLN